MNSIYFIGLVFFIGILVVIKIQSGKNITTPAKTSHKNLPVNNKVIERFRFVDVETANKNPNSICAIAVAKMENGHISSKRWLVKPPTKDFIFSDLHGITYDMVKDCPTFDIIWKNYAFPYLQPGKYTLVAHYAHFDINSIFQTLKYYNVQYNDIFTVSDSCIIARRLLPSLPNHKLNTLANHFKIQLKHHDPLSDVMACANIFNLFIQTNCEKVISWMSTANVYANKSLYNKEFFN